MRAPLPLLMLSPALWVACADGPASETGTPLPPPCTDCAITDAHNYSLTSEMVGDVVKLKALTDATIDWSGLSVDVQGHGVQPTDVTQVLLVAFAELPPEAVMEGLARDQLTQSEVAIYVICEPEGATSCDLSDFGILSSTFDVEQYFLPSVQTWMVVPTRPGQQGGFSFLFLQADDGATATTATVTNTSASLEVDVDLASALPLVVPPGEAAIQLDWSGLTTDGLGNAMEARTIDQLWVARYDRPVSSLEGAIFDLELDALDLYTLDLAGGTSASLADLQGDTPFTGITTDSTWLLALRCSTCTHPAPRFMATLVADDGG